MSDNGTDMLKTLAKVGVAVVAFLLAARLLLVAGAVFRFILLPLAILLPIAAVIGLYRVVEQAPNHYGTTTGRQSRTITEDVAPSDDAACHVCMTEDADVREVTIRELAIRGNAVMELGRSSEAYCEEHHITAETLEEDLEQQFDSELNEELQEDMLEEK